MGVGGGGVEILLFGGDPTFWERLQAFSLVVWGKANKACMKTPFVPLSLRDELKGKNSCLQIFLITNRETNSPL